MKDFKVLQFVGIILLFGLAATAFTAQEEPTTATEKLVTLDINGYSSLIASTEDNVGALVQAELGYNPNWVITPEPASPLQAGDVIRVWDANEQDLNPTVQESIALALTPEEPPEEQADEPTPPQVVDKPQEKVYSGLATWYRWGNGLNTASRDFPRGTKLRVTAVNSGRTVDVVVNDYGPAEYTGVALDLNSVAFEQLAPLGAGKIEIEYFVIS